MRLLNNLQRDDGLLAGRNEAGILRIPAMPGRHSEVCRATVPVQAGLMSGGVWPVVENWALVYGISS